MQGAAGIGLLVKAPIEVAERIVVTLGDTLKKGRHVETVPLGVQIEAEAEARRGISDDAQIARIIDRSAFRYFLIAVQVFVFRPSGYDVQRSPRNDFGFVQIFDLFCVLEEAVALQTPDFA